MNMHICAIVCACDLCIALACLCECVFLGACAAWKQNELLITSLKIKSNQSVWYAKCCFFLF